MKTTEIKLEKAIQLVIMDAIEKGHTNANELKLESKTGSATYPLRFNITRDSGIFQIYDRVIVANLTIRNLTAASCDVKADTNGNVYCGTDATGGSGDGSGGWFNTTTYTTTTLPVNITNTLYAYVVRANLTWGDLNDSSMPNACSSGNFLSDLSPTGSICNALAEDSSYLSYSGYTLSLDTSFATGINTTRNIEQLGFYNVSNLIANFVNRSLWTSIDNYPSACGAGQYVTAIGDTLTCSVPSYTTAQIDTISTNLQSNITNVQSGLTSLTSNFTNKPDSTAGWINTTTYTQTTLNVNITVTLKTGNITSYSNNDFKIANATNNWFVHNASGTYILN
jgi:hypothetical protein